MKARTPSVRAGLVRKPQPTRRKVLTAIISIALAPAGLAASGASPADAATGNIEFRVVRAGLIVGFGGGSGSLFYKGNRYPFSIGGISVGATIGIASIDFVGRARNLSRPRDIEGNYRAVAAGLSVAGGGAVARLRNSRGVELEVSGKKIGLKASADLNGLRIRLER